MTLLLIWLVRQWAAIGAVCHDSIGNMSDNDNFGTDMVGAPFFYEDGS